MPIHPGKARKCSIWTQSNHGTAVASLSAVVQRRKEWAKLIPPTQWSIYREVILAAQHERIPFAIGGAFAVATYTGSWRNTKDLDLYVLPEYRDRMIAMLT